MLDIHSPNLDLESWRQLANIKFAELENKLDNLNREVGNILTRLKALDDLRIQSELSFLQAEVKELKKKVLEPKSNLAEKIKKIIKS